MKLFFSLIAASAAASKQSVTTLSFQERTQLREELAKWRQEFGAKAQSLMPPSVQGMNALEAETDALQRFYNNKLAIDEARRNNPDATFDYNHPYALMTPAEFKEHVVGFSFQDGLHAARSLPSVELDVSSVKAASVDWTTGYCVNSVRDQGICGSCWAFSAVGTAESAHCISTGELLDLSEQQVVSCSTLNNGCSGGVPWYGLDFMSSEGMCVERDYPYTSGGQGITGTCMRSCAKKFLSMGATVQVTGESALETALNTQPVSVAVEAGNAVWQNYRSGVVSQCPGAQSDHAVIAVGYDGSSYKIRNSWGANWGESGHIRLQRGSGGKGMCNVAEFVSFPQISGSPNPTVSPSPTNPTSKRPTTKPTPTTRPTPTTKPNPRPDCGTCTVCFYPAGNQCLDGYTKSDCDYYSANYGTVWCGI
ncbi:hypothetical protein DYB32_008722 [Aphanomyces invadans]|uniref:Peptidase C1A papain C-terminal domain-containing protein n=1 Tax=Aphanomyces invadans TaxID=157072 RepID=A0A3R7A4V7_9STRA|nr:hypothetical protein DYB32_008722 [Aphanomyces invadans]